MRWPREEGVSVTAAETTGNDRPMLALPRLRWHAFADPLGSSAMVYLGPATEAFPPGGYRFLYPGAMSLFGFIGFSVLRIPRGWSSPLYLIPLFTSVVLCYGMFWFIWVYFGLGIALACLAMPYILAVLAGVTMPVWVRSVLVYLAFLGGILCTDLAVHLGQFG